MSTNKATSHRVTIARSARPLRCRAAARARAAAAWRRVLALLLLLRASLAPFYGDRVVVQVSEEEVATARAGAIYQSTTIA